MRGLLFALGLALVVFGMFGVPDLAGADYEWWMGCIPSFLGGALAVSAVTA